MRNREALRRELLEQIEHIGAWEAEDPEILREKRMLESGGEAGDPAGAFLLRQEAGCTSGIGGG